MKTGIDSENRRCYDILQTLKDKKGNYIPIICIEGEKGFYKTDWEWGMNYEFAKQIAKDKNREMGIEPKEAMKIVASTFGKFA